MISENCKTCSFSAMHDFAMKFGEKGFTKGEMKENLGNEFCESEWLKWSALQRRMMSPTFHYSVELKEWYLS